MRDLQNKTLPQTSQLHRLSQLLRENYSNVHSIWLYQKLCHPGASPALPSQGLSATRFLGCLAHHTIFPPTRNLSTSRAHTLEELHCGSYKYHSSWFQAVCLVRLPWSLLQRSSLGLLALQPAVWLRLLYLKDTEEGAEVYIIPVKCSTHYLQEQSGEMACRLGNKNA